MDFFDFLIAIHAFGILTGHISDHGVKHFQVRSDASADLTNHKLGIVDKVLIAFVDKFLGQIDPSGHNFRIQSFRLCIYIRFRKQDTVIV